MRIAGDRSVAGLVEAARRGRLVERLLGGTRRKLWGVAFLFFFLGDVATTYVGLSMHGVVEAGPVVAPLLREHGLVAMVGLKGALVGLLYGAARVLPEPHAVGVPLGLALLGVLVTVWNLTVLGLGAL